MTKDNVFGFVDDLQKLYDSIEDVRKVYIKSRAVFAGNSYQQLEELDVSLCELWHNYCNLKDENNICECTAPQVDSDGMCICGRPISEDDDWTNDSGYSDVFK